MMKSRPSALDYTITISRKFRYLVVGSSEFGFQVASHALDASRLSPESIGNAVLTVLASIDCRLHQLEREGRPAPSPQLKRLNRDIVTARRAARMLGVSVKTLRRMAAQGLIRVERTPGGHLRFSMDSITDYLIKGAA